MTGTTMTSRFEEPAECLDCGLKCEATDLIRTSLDAYADKSTDYDLLCPLCQHDNIKLHRPKEDKEKWK